jgi:hypothetical protein
LVIQQRPLCWCPLLQGPYRVGAGHRAAELSGPGGEEEGEAAGL